MTGRSLAAAALTLMVAHVVAAVLAAGPAAANQTRLPDRWPAGEALSGVVEREVRFSSYSPFSPADIRVSDLATVQAHGRLFLPRGRHRAGSLPAVILLHGAAGVLGAREHRYARQFAAMGVAALVIDVFAPRVKPGYRFVDRLLNITETMLVTDAYAGLRYLKGVRAVDTGRVALMGFSYGAMASMYSMNEGLRGWIAERLKAPKLRFAGHVAFYGPCLGGFEDRKTTGAPLLMLYGGKDELIDPKRCAEIADNLRDGGSRVRIVAYPDALHQWDGPWSRFRIGRILARCRFEVEKSGLIRDRRTLMLMTNPFMRKVILALCVTNRGYLIGGDARIRAKSNREVARFLNRVFAAPPRRARDRAPPGAPPQ